MAFRADAEVHTYDQPEPMGKAFAGAIFTHAAAAGLVIASALFHFNTSTYGAEHSSGGAIDISVVKTVPIPRREGPTNPLANESKTLAPQEPAKEKPVQQVKVPAPDAIPLPSKYEKPKKISPKQEAATLFRPQEYKSNQIYAKSPQAMNSPMYGMQGAGGIDVGPASVLGTKNDSGYTALLRERISQHWNTADVHALPAQKCSVSFTIAHSGEVTNVQVAHASGSYLLDTSAKRAILDANPLPALPPQFGGSVTVELWFQLNQ